MDILPALNGRQLPQPGRLITRLRDVTILDLPSVDQPKPTCTRTAVIFADDPQADPRIFDVLLSFHYRAFQRRLSLVGIAKVRHTTGPAVRWWYAQPLDAATAQRALNDAAHAALRHSSDHWSVEPPVLVTLRADGTVNRDRLPENDLLRLSVPERYILGTVRA